MKRAALIFMAGTTGLAAEPIPGGMNLRCGFLQEGANFGEESLPVATDKTPEANPSDLLRFTNADQLNGHFAGIKPGPLILWQRDDLSAPVEFKTSQLRQVVFRNGRPAKPLPGPALVALTNGDRIPGVLAALDDRQITLDTPFAGAITLPRNIVTMIAPNPVGARTLYTGPFSEEGWEILASNESANRQSGPPNPSKPEPAKDTPGWSYVGGAWYNRLPFAALRRNVDMPDRTLIRFQLAWKTRLALALAFHADFKSSDKPDESEENKNLQAGPQAFPKAFGNSYVLNLYPNYAILYRCSMNKEGQANVERIQAGGTNIRLPETGDARIELRCNRQTGDISLYLNDEFATQWTEPGGTGYAAPGGGIGLISGGGVVRVTDLVVAEWNGMPDSARSMQTDDQDVVLLSNGTDRFAGEVTTFQNGKLSLKARYGDFQFPLGDVAEVRFARKHLAKSEPPATDPVRLRFPSIGEISGIPESAANNRLRLVSPLAGKLDIDLDYAVMLDFKNSNSFIDDWDPPF